MAGSGQTPARPPESGDPLRQLAARVACEGPPMALVGRQPQEPPVFGDLVSAGPRTSPDAGVFAFVVEAVREGYLCHYEKPRVLENPDPDLSLLAGDLFYAIGINALAVLGDDQSVHLLSDLIVVSAELRSEGRRADAESIWVARILALACGSDDEHVTLVESLARAETGSSQALGDWSDRIAEANGLSRHIDEVRHLIHFAPNP